MTSSHGTDGPVWLVQVPIDNMLTALVHNAMRARQNGEVRRLADEVGRACSVESGLAVRVCGDDDSASCRLVHVCMMGALWRLCI